MARVDEHRFVFLGGLHRSGTTLLARSLAAHPSVSGFRDTGVPADEGQHLQSVYPRAKVYGGPGRFGFAADTHLTEHSSLVSSESRERLLAEWGRYWDLEKPVLLEKSPPNLTKTRFLQALFPEAFFVVIVRHPIPVTLATARWRGTRRYHRLIEHWLRCHEVFAEDRSRLARAHVLSYEDLVLEPAATLTRLYKFLALDGEPVAPDLDPGSNARYFERWAALRRDGAPGMRAYIGLIGARYERRLSRFGYSLLEPERARSRTSS
jgi:hypothetical protein